MAATWDDDRLTLVGLLAETWAGMGRTITRRLEADCGLSVQWFELLLRLVRTPGNRLRMTDLAAQSTLTPSGLTRAIDRLVAAGLVTREHCDEDRRGAFAVLTDAGRARIEAALPVHVVQVETVLLAGLSDDDRHDLERLLRVLRANVNPCAAAASTCPVGDDAEVGAEA
jgi:MarR family transcriptional regulator, 2-MHQ and catechol-resistance regulon repressor